MAPPNQEALLRAAVILGIVMAALLAARTALPDSRIREKQAEARRTLAEIDALGHALGRAIEAYDGATYRLERTRASLHVNEVELRVARHDLRVGDGRLAAWLRQLYMQGSDDPTTAVLLGARSVDDLITGLEQARQISEQDAQLVGEVERFQHAVVRRRAALNQARRAEERIVAQRAAARARIAAGLAEQRRLFSSIRSEIGKLRREQAIRQARLAAEIQARLAAQRAAEQQALRATVVGATATGPPGPNGLPTAAVLPTSSIGNRVVAIATQYLGRPYVWGAAGPYAFDCSGLVTYVFAQVGISLPHYAASQWNYGVYVPKDQLEPGDLVFFENLGHVGIYAGSGEYIQAPQPGDVVKITPLSDQWSAANYYGAKRISG